VIELSEQIAKRAFDEASMASLNGYLVSLRRRTRNEELRLRFEGDLSVFFNGELL
jgi:hypothetical protein